MNRRTIIPIVLIVLGLGTLFFALRPATREAGQERTIDLEVWDRANRASRRKPSRGR